MMIDGHPMNSQRRALTLFELTVVAGLLAVLAATFAQVLVSLSAGGTKLQRNAVGRRAMDNLAEEYQALSGTALEEKRAAWAAMSPEDLAKLELPEEVVGRLPGAKLSVGIAEKSEPAGVLRLTIDLSWQNRSGQYGRPLRLVVWNYSQTKSG